MTNFTNKFKSGNKNGTKYIYGIKVKPQYIQLSFVWASAPIIISQKQIKYIQLWKLVVMLSMVLLRGVYWKSSTNICIVNRCDLRVRVYAIFIEKSTLVWMFFLISAALKLLVCWLMIIP